MPCGTGTDRDPRWTSFRDKIGHAAMACRRSMCSETNHACAAMGYQHAEICCASDRGHVMCADAASCNTQLCASSHQRMWGSVFVREPSKGTGRADGTVRLPCDRTVVGQGEDGCRTTAVFRWAVGRYACICNCWCSLHIRCMNCSYFLVVMDSVFDLYACLRSCVGGPHVTVVAPWLRAGHRIFRGCSGLLIYWDNECGGWGSHGNGDACPSPVLPQAHERLLHLSSGLSGTGPRNLWGFVTFRQTSWQPNFCYLSQKNRTSVRKKRKRMKIITLLHYMCQVNNLAKFAFTWIYDHPCYGYWIYSFRRGLAPSD